MASASLVFIRIAHRDSETLINEATLAFSKDFATFARSNNRGDLEVTVKELRKAGQDRAYAEAVTEGYKAANLVTGYIGAKAGKFSDQPADTQLTFNTAVERFTEAFKQSLIDSGLFVNPVPKTDAEKAKAKEAKETKAKEAKDAMITAMVQSGELVRAVDVKTIKDLSVFAMIDELSTREFSASALEQLTMLYSMVTAAAAAAAEQAGAAAAAAA